MSKYTNSPLVVYTEISPNKTTNRNHDIDTITIHCVVGQCTAEGLGGWFAKESTQASSNYGVDKDGRIGMYVEEKDRSWCTSSRENDHRAITIEVASDTKHPYAVRDVAYEALIELVADICKRNGIKRLVWSEDKTERMQHLNGCNMTVHRDYANKSCPGQYLYERHGEIADRVNALLTEEDEDMIVKCPHCGEDIKVTLSKVEAEPVPAPQEPEKPREYKVGDVVTFTGNKHYKSADASTAYDCGQGEATITSIYKLGSSKHPYHLVRTGLVGPYGWVDAGTFK